MLSLEDFRNIWIADYEFIGGEGNPPIPICCVAKNIRTGEVIQEWLIRDFKPINPPPKLKYSIDKKTLFVAYYSIAEISCHLSLNYDIPPYILDLFTEFRCLTNGLIIPSGNSLIGACQYFGIIGSDFEYKDVMRKRILQGPPYSEQEKKDILHYCLQDVLMLEKLFNEMKEKINLKFALIRGRYMGALAQVERYGIPIDIEKLNDLKECWDIIKEELIWRVDQQYHVFDGTTFKIKKFEKYLESHNISWDYTPEGHPKTDDTYMKEQAKVHPELKPLQELRYSIGQLRLNDLQIGSDGRNRAMISPFRSITGRNQPSSSKFIFGNATWLRHLIKPSEGMALAYVDYEQQEIAIAAALSNDPSLINAYNSGDPYLSFAKSTGAIPPEGTKKTHPNERDLYKTMMLAINYGMMPETFAKRSGVTKIEAKNMYKIYRRTYKKYWDWNQNFCDMGGLLGEVSTSFGWKFRTHHIKRPNTLKNWPMQSHGADILRLAICFCLENNIRVVAPVHDAILIEAPLNEIEEKVRITQKLMGDASEYVINFRIRTEAKIIKFPENYSDPRGIVMWDNVWNIINNLSPEEKQLRIHGKDMQLLDFDTKTEKKPKNTKISNRRKSQLRLKPQNITERNLANRLRKISVFSHIEVMNLINAAREKDFDLEMEIDWKNSSYETALNQIKRKTGQKMGELQEGDNDFY